MASSEAQTAPDCGARFFGALRELRMTTARLVLYRRNPPLRARLSCTLEQAKGIDVSLVLIDRPRTIRNELDVRAFAAWAASVAREFPQVRRFVVWNEPNSRSFWHGGPELYARLLRTTYRALKDVDPEIRVSGFGLAASHRPVEFLRRALAAGATMDELSVHPYPPTNAATAAGAYRFVRRVERAWPGPLNLDEFGWQVATAGVGYTGRENVTTSTEADQARRYEQFLRLAARDPRVRSALVYRLVDDADLAGWQAGLIRANGSSREAFHVLRQYLSASDGA
ncbi:MAG: hypothetical protein ABR521_09150 [Gaiellaceae bacterium]